MNLSSGFPTIGAVQAALRKELAARCTIGLPARAMLVVRSAEDFELHLFEATETTGLRFWNENATGEKFSVLEIKPGSDNRVNAFELIQLAKGS